jgi:hypothetical protein
VEARALDTELHLARGPENKAQPRDLARAMTVLQAWQAEVFRKAVAMNREGDRRGVKHFLEWEVRRIERYARGLDGAEPLLAELVLLLRRADEELDPRLSKELYAASAARAFSAPEHRSAPRASLSARLRREQP